MELLWRKCLIILEPNIEDIKNKRDAVYEKAIDIAKQKITK